MEKSEERIGSRLRRWACLLAVAVTTAGLAACGGDDDTPLPEPPTPAEGGGSGGSGTPVVVPEGISCIPEAPDADQTLTITFKASASSQLYGYTGDVYAHIGVVDATDWLYVPADWTTNIAKCKMASTSTNTWNLTLSPSVREWFGSGTTPITKIGIVIRSSDGSKKGLVDDYFITVTDNRYQGFTPGEVSYAPLPAGCIEGINIVDNTTVTLVLYDVDTNGAHKDFAYAIGDFNDWTLSNTDASQMKRDDASGCWWITLSGLDPDREYGFQYYVGKGNETTRLGDAYTEKILDPYNDQYIPASTYDESLAYPSGGRDMVSTFKIRKDDYAWQVTDFKIADPDKLVIYEMLLRDFTDTGDLPGAMGKLDYLKELGVNAVELMPVQEFDGNDSWGYNPCFYFAMDKAYGTKRMYKQFIDQCHEAGIAVILDVVYNHATGSHPFAKLYFDGDKTAANNPYFNVVEPHPYGAFHDFNHESPLVRKYIKRNLQFLINEYHIDGFRFDMTKGFTQNKSTEATAAIYDASRVAILKDYAAAIREVKSDAYIILEHFCDTQEENELAADGIHLWRNVNEAFCQSAMGYPEKSQFTYLYTTKPNWVGYMESHDEERMAYKQLAYGSGALSTDLSLRMKQLEVNAAFCFAVPGPKMIWQFGELGYDVSINENGRTGRKPLHWEYYDNSSRKSLHDLYAKMLALRNDYPELFNQTASLSWRVGVSDWDNGRSLLVQSADGSKKLVVLGNFTSNTISIAFPGSTGSWTNYLTGEAVTVNSSVEVPAHSYRIYLSE